MAFTDIASIFAFTNKTANQPSTSGSLTSSTLAGDLVVLTIAVDNNSASDTTTENAVTGIVDSAGGNTWTNIGQFTNADGGAQNGSHIEAWFSVLTNGVASGGSITASFTASTSRDASVFLARRFTKGAGTTVSVFAGTLVQNDNAEGAPDPGADDLDITGDGTTELLRLVHCSLETNASAANTGESNSYIAWTQGTTTGGGAAGNIAGRGYHKISTATNDSFAFISPGNGVNGDAQAWVYYGLYEVTPSGETAGSATGTCTVTGVGQSRVTTVGSAAGTCTVSGVGQSTVPVVGSSAGTCTVSAASLAMLFMVGAAAGTCTVTGVAQSLAQTVGNAAGTCTVEGIGVSTVPVVGSAAGTCTVEGIGVSTVPVVGNAAGTCTVTGIAFVANDETAGSAAGTCTVEGVAVSTTETVGSAAGTCTVSGIGVSLAQTAGTAAGTCTVSGIAQSGVPIVGSAAGTCTVSGTAQSGVTAVGSAAGTCTVSGVAVSLAQTTGNAAGTCIVTGVGAFTGGATETAGSAAGTCTVEGVAQSTAEAVGNASGTCTVTGVLIDANSAADPGPTVGSHNHFFITMGKMGWIKRAA